MPWFVKQNWDKFPKKTSWGPPNRFVIILLIQSTSKFNWSVPFDRWWWFCKWSSQCTGETGSVEHHATQMCAATKELFVECNDRSTNSRQVLFNGHRCDWKPCKKSLKVWLTLISPICHLTVVFVCLIIVGYGTFSSQLKTMRACKTHPSGRGQLCDYCLRLDIELLLPQSAANIVRWCSMCPSILKKYTV